MLTVALEETLLELLVLVWLILIWIHLQTHKHYEVLYMYMIKQPFFLYSLTCSRVMDYIQGSETNEAAALGFHLRYSTKF